MPSISPTRQLRSIPPTRQLRQALPEGPRFLDLSGNVISEIACGQPYQFDIPGYSQAYIRVYQNNTLTFEGVHDIPMPPYTSVCETDVGRFLVQAYDPTTYAELGEASLNITGGSGLPFGLSTTGLLAIAGVGLLLFSRGRK